jgi:hypothetical protein
MLRSEDDPRGCRARVLPSKGANVHSFTYEQQLFYWLGRACGFTGLRLAGMVTAGSRLFRFGIRGSADVFTNQLGMWRWLEIMGMLAGILPIHRATFVFFNVWVRRCA